MPDRKAWQCHLSERDWAIIFHAWDNAMSLEEAVRKYPEYEALSVELGHHGNCVKEAEACFTCMLEDDRREGKLMMEVWNKARPIPDNYKYL